MRVDEARAEQLDRPKVGLDLRVHVDRLQPQIPLPLLPFCRSCTRTSEMAARVGPMVTPARAPIRPAAATGQIALSGVWAELLHGEGLTAAQILVTLDDLEPFDPHRFAEHLLTGSA